MCPKAMPQRMYRKWLVDLRDPGCWRLLDNRIAEVVATDDAGAGGGRQGLAREHPDPPNSRPAFGYLRSKDDRQMLSTFGRVVTDGPSTFTPSTSRHRNRNGAERLIPGAGRHVPSDGQVGQVIANRCRLDARMRRALLLGHVTQEVPRQSV